MFLAASSFYCRQDTEEGSQRFLAVVREMLRGVKREDTKEPVVTRGKRALLVVILGSASVIHFEQSEKSPKFIFKPFIGAPLSPNTTL